MLALLARVMELGLSQLELHGSLLAIHGRGRGEVCGWLQNGAYLLLLIVVALGLLSLR